MFSSLNVPVTSTNAVFVSQTKNKSSFQARTWFDNSLLEFTNNVGGDCKEIFADIKNIGSGDMGITSTYSVYYSETGNPVDPKGGTGELVFSKGEIPKMKAKGSVKLTYTPKKQGFYMFVAFQHPDKPIGSGDLVIDKKAATVSNKINVNNCSKQ